jgi:predicted ATPase/DNA-binding SARP family transcriptional activator
MRLDGVEVGGQISTKSRALLCYLAVTGQPHSREKLAGLLWGDKPEKSAKANLRKSLSTLRQVLGNALIINRQSVAFNRDSAYQLDVEVFETALAEDDPAPEKLNPLREAVELYRGDFLEGLSVRQALGFEEWVLSERERLRQMAIQALKRLSAVYTVRGEYAAGIEVTHQLLSLEPWQEEAHQQLMILLARSGQHSAALAQYDTCRRILAEELGVEPLPETQALYHRLKTRRQAAPHNLPPQTTTFVGRQTELSQIANYLAQPDCRLLTLIGVGGIGKTRLALQAAGQALDAFADGVYFVSLAGVSSPEFLVPTIGEAIDYPLSGETDPKRQLLNCLHQKEMLLVLDNFEHLLSAPGGNGGGRELVLEIVRTAPKLKMLVTSRERLNLQTEWLLALQGLAYPPPETAFGEEESFEAVELFVQGAHRMQPDFALSTEWPAVMNLCRLLDGMPLGIELAATWVSIMPCAEIVKELSRGLDLLSTTLYDVPARHRSLEAVFDHSWQLLSEVERAVFRELSVFRGGFDRQAAQQVAGATLATLAGLVNKSLLRVNSAGRYDMLEPLKQYAAAKLAETPAEDEQVRDRHCDYYASVLKRLETDIMGDESQRRALVEIGQDIDNIRLSWGRAASRGNLEAIQKGHRCLWAYCDVRGWYREGDEAFQKAVNGIVGNYSELAEESRTVLGQVLARQAWCRWRLGLHRKSIQVLRQSLACFRHETPETRGEVGFALSQLGMNELNIGNFDEAKSILQQSLALGREIGNWFIIEMSLNALSYAARSLGEYSEAAKLCHESIALSKQVSDRRGEVFMVNHLAWVANAMGDPVEARRWLQEAFAFHKETDDKPLVAESLSQLGTAAYLEGLYEEAKKRYLESIEITKETGERWRTGSTLTGLGYTTCVLGEYEASGRYFCQALQMAMEIEALWMAMDALAGFAKLLTASDPGEAAAERAVELLAFVLNQSTSSQETRDRAAPLLAELEGRLSAAAVAAAKERGQVRDLQAIVEEVMAKKQRIT